MLLRFVRGLVALVLCTASAQAQISICSVQDPALKVRSEPGGTILATLNHQAVIWKLSRSQTDPRWVQIARRDEAGALSTGFVVGRYLSCSPDQSTLQQLSCSELSLLTRTLFAGSSESQRISHKQVYRLEQSCNGSFGATSKSPSQTADANPSKSASPANSVPAPQSDRDRMAFGSVPTSWDGVTATRGAQLVEPNESDSTICKAKPIAEPKLTIQACTRLIGSGGVPGNVAEAFKNRADAYNLAAIFDDIKDGYQQAIGDYTEAIKLKPDFFDAFNDRAQVFLWLHNYDQALADCNAAIRINPAGAESYAGRGRLYNAKGQYDQAIASFDEAIVRSSANAYTYYSRGRAFVGKRDNARALADFDKAIGLNPNDGMYYVGRGNIYYELKQYDRAIDDYNLAAQKSTWYAETYRRRGNAFSSKGQFDRAIADFDHAINLDAKSPFAFASRGIAYEGKGNFEHARRDYETTLALAPGNADGELAHSIARERLAALQKNAETKRNEPIAPKARKPSDTETDRILQNFLKDKPDIRKSPDEFLRLLSEFEKRYPNMPLEEMLQLAYAETKRLLAKERGPTLTGTGSGFFVDRTGYILTNNHVVAECSAISTKGYGKAQVVRRDQNNDLALIKVTLEKTVEPARFREDELDLAERVFTAGYPLFGQLATQLNVTSGMVSSMGGFRDDSRYLQITAPVQPGNSGGPIIEESGRVAGVVTKKLESGENVAFALRASYALAFLRGARVTPIVDAKSNRRSDKDIAKEADGYTVLVGCFN